MLVLDVAAAATAAASIHSTRIFKMTSNCKVSNRNCLFEFRPTVHDASKSKKTTNLLARTVLYNAAIEVRVEVDEANVEDMSLVTDLEDL